MASSKLLLAAKSLSVDPGAANAKNLLAVAARCDKLKMGPDMYQMFSFPVLVCYRKHIVKNTCIKFRKIRFFY